MDPRYPGILSAIFYVIFILVGLVWLVEHLNIGG